MDRRWKIILLLLFYIILAEYKPNSKIPFLLDLSIRVIYSILRIEMTFDRVRNISHTFNPLRISQFYDVLFWLN